jgi:hypothetical protein
MMMMARISEGRLMSLVVMVVSTLASFRVNAFGVQVQVPSSNNRGAHIKGYRTTPKDYHGQHIIISSALQAQAKKGGDKATKATSKKRVTTKKQKTETAEPSSSPAKTAKAKTAVVAATTGIATVIPMKTTSPLQPQLVTSSTIVPAVGTTLLRIPSDYDQITSHKARPGIDDSLLNENNDNGRPGAILETEEQLAIKQEIFNELDSGERQYDPKIMNEYGTLQDELETAYDIDDPDAIDMATLGTWTIKDLQSKFDFEWDPEAGDPDPNFVTLQQPGVKYKAGTDMDDDGVEIGYDPMFGPSNPMDSRTIIGAVESYMINEKTRNESMLTPEFLEGDLEIQYNQDIVKFRKSLDIIETYTDAFLPPEIQIPLHVAKWHGYPEPMSFPHRPNRHNPFVDPATATDFSKLDPYQARRKAVELARAQNSDWLPQGKSQAWHAAQREPYENVKTLVGTLRKADHIDENLVREMQPALDILGSCVELLSIEGEEQTVFRFAYHGLMRHRRGITAWSEKLIRNCGVEVTGIIMETGFRRRDPSYDGGDHWYPPST